MKPYASLRANGSRECAPDDRLREANHFAAQRKNGLLRRFRLRSLSYGGQVAPRNDGELHPDSFVVPAKAGTHTPCPIILDAEAETFCSNERRWLWVPAFAGTTQEDSLVKQQTRLYTPRREAPESCIYLAPKKTEGVGNAGCPLHPQPRVQR
jgi:hypothetical protein